MAEIGGGFEGGVRWLTDKMWRGLHFSYQGSQVRQVGLWVRLAAFIVWPCRWKTCFDFSLENCLSFPCLMLCPEFPLVLTQKQNGPALEMNEFVSLSEPELKPNNKLTEKIHDLWLCQRLNQKGNLMGKSSTTEMTKIYSDLFFSVPSTLFYGVATPLPNLNGLLSRT